MLDWIISSSVLIIVMLILRKAFRRKISRRIVYALWILILIRMLVPVGIGNSDYSVAAAVRAVQTVVHTLSAESADDSFGEAAEKISPVSQSEGMHTGHAGRSEERLIEDSAVPIYQGKGSSQKEKVPEGPGVSAGSKDILQSAADFLSVPPVLIVVWASGMIILAGWFMIISIRMMIRHRGAV